MRSVTFLVRGSAQKFSGLALETPPSSRATVSAASISKSGGKEGGGRGVIARPGFGGEGQGEALVLKAAPGSIIHGCNRTTKQETTWKKAPPSWKTLAERLPLEPQLPIDRSSTALSDRAGPSSGPRAPELLVTFRC